MILQSRHIYLTLYKIFSVRKLEFLLEVTFYDALANDKFMNPKQNQLGLSDVLRCIFIWLDVITSLKNQHPVTNSPIELFKKKST